MAGLWLNFAVKPLTNVYKCAQLHAYITTHTFIRCPRAYCNSTDSRGGVVVATVCVPRTATGLTTQFGRPHIQFACLEVTLGVESLRS